MRVRRHSHIFALGDAAFGTDTSGTRLPATAQV
jgi:NADH dehydrogenase FAD-containing subunit